MTTEEGRIGRVEGILEEVQNRLNSVDNRLNNLDSRISGLETRMHTQFYWLLGVMLTMWVTIILAILLRM